MAELTGRNGTWTFDGDVLRVVPADTEDVSRLRAALGTITVPLTALSGIAHDAGRVRLRLRAGADPLLQACGGRLGDDADPYLLEVPAEHGRGAKSFADELRDALSIAQIPAEPTDRYLVSAPPVPISANGQDGTGSFDGDVVRLEWGWLADVKKRSTGNREWPLAALEAVEWWPPVGTDWGWIRFRVHGDPEAIAANPRLDPNCLTLWGAKKESGSSVVLAAAIVGRMPHPNAAPEMRLPAPDSDAPDHDALLRRLRELGELRRDGVLTDEEFATAKQAVLKRM
jgi:hypothetical protein